MKTKKKTNGFLFQGLNYRLTAFLTPAWKKVEKLLTTVTYGSSFFQFSIELIGISSLFTLFF